MNGNYNLEDNANIKEPPSHLLRPRVTQCSQSPRNWFKSTYIPFPENSQSKCNFHFHAANSSCVVMGSIAWLWLEQLWRRLIWRELNLHWGTLFFGVQTARKAWKWPHLYTTTQKCIPVTSPFHWAKQYLSNVYFSMLENPSSLPPSRMTDVTTTCANIITLGKW